MEDKILNFLKELKRAYYLNEKIYTEGSCLRLCLALKSLFPAAKILYSEKDLHYALQIEDIVVDINGKLSPDYVMFKEYYEATEQQIQNDQVASYGGLTNKKGKYIKTI